MRARVLKIDGEQVTLGVYYQGEWWRVQARTLIQLQLQAWIEGELIFPENGQEVFFRIEQVPEGGQPEDMQEEMHDDPSSGAIDLEA